MHDGELFNQWLRIGEISKLFNIDAQTLRYYESIGLFVPAKRDPYSDYRNYHFSQTYQLASILYLRKLGYSLKQIREYTENRDSDFVIKRLKVQSQKIVREWKSLIQINKAIDRKISFIEKKTCNLNPDFIEVKKFPTRYYKLIGPEEVMYKNPDYYIYPAVVFYDQNNKRLFGAFLGEGRGKTKGAQEITAGEFLCGYHQGFYDSMEETFRRLRQHGEKQRLHLDTGSVNINIIDLFVEAHSEHYLTEVQIRVLD